MMSSENIDLYAIRQSIVINILKNYLKVRNICNEAMNYMGKYKIDIELRGKLNQLLQRIFK